MQAKWMCLETRDSDYLHTGMELARAGIKWMHNLSSVESRGSCLRPPQSRMRVGNWGASPSQEHEIQFPSCPKDKKLSVNSHTKFSDPINHGRGPCQEEGKSRLLRVQRPKFLAAESGPVPRGGHPTLSLPHQPAASKNFCTHNIPAHTPVLPSRLPDRTPCAAGPQST